MIIVAYRTPVAKKIERRKVVIDVMESPSLIGKVIAELIDRGLTRDFLASELDVKPPTISGLKSGKGSLDDSKLGRLAQLHGGYSEHDLKVMKYLEWLEKEKGITPGDIKSVTQRRVEYQASASVA